MVWAGLDLQIHTDLEPSINYVTLFWPILDPHPSPSSNGVTKIQTPSNIIISGRPLTERTCRPSCFFIHAASAAQRSPQAAIGPETSAATRRTFGWSSEENS